MKKFCTLLIVLLGAGLLSLRAQEHQQDVKITGTVTSVEDGKPMAGVSVVISGSTVGVATTAEGKYEITVPSDTVKLEFSFIGFQTQLVELAGRSVIDIVLLPVSQQIEEVMIVAYGTTTKSAFTGSASVIKAEKIEKLVTTNVTAALAGTAPGVQVLTSSGDPTNKTQTIRVRGIGSMSASSAPYIILDGMPYDGAISDININDVESMSVLKDASASAIYGARGANGVILITTKRAHGEDMPNIKFESRFGVNSRLVPQYDVITDPGEYYETWFKLMYNKQFYAGHSVAESYEYARNYLFDEKNGGLGYQIFTVPEGQSLIGTNFKLNPNATLGYSDGQYYYYPDNWYDEVFHNSFRQEYNLSLSGSSEKLSYYGSVGLLDDGGFVNNSNYKRYTARVNASYQAKKWLKFSTDVGYSHSDSEIPDYTDTFGSSGNLFYICNTVAPIYPLYVRGLDGMVLTDETGYKVYDANQTNFKRPSMVGNAVGDNEHDRKKQYADVVNAKIGLVFTPVKGLDFTANVGLTNDNTRYNALYSPFSSSTSNVDGVVYVSSDRFFAVTAQALANYKTDFGGSRHSIDILAGFERYQLKSQYNAGENSHLFDPFIGELDNAGTILEQKAWSGTTNYMTEGFLGRFQYNFAKRIFVSASYRRDASSRFAKGHRWGDFGSVGLGWNFAANEPAESWLDLFKVKASWGMQGNDNIGGYFPYADQFSHSYNEETGDYSLVMSYKGNEELTWEQSNALNIGIDFGFFDGRLNGSIELFDRTTENMLYNRPVPISASNPTGIEPKNVGSMSNVGFEFIADAVFIRKDKVNWNFNLNFTSYRNQIQSLDESISEEGIKQPHSIIRVGGSMYNAYMRKYAGVDKKDGTPLYYKKLRDANGKETGKVGVTKIFTEADQFELGTVLPDLFGGFGTTFEAYGFDISMQFQFQLGGLYYDGSYQAMMLTQSNAGHNIHRDLLKAWTPENPDSDYPRLDGNTLVGQSSVDRFLVSSDYLSLNSAQIGYTFPKAWMNKLQIGSLRIYVAGENLFLLTARQGIDPRISFGMGSYTSGSGLNTGGYGNMRSIIGGINITF